MKPTQSPGKKQKNIVLMGFMGTGKTSAGKTVASKLKMTFLDMDEVISKRAGKPVSRIFAEDGEAHFRSLERSLVKELSGTKGLVIATGGGIVLNPENIKDFSRSGLVVCLMARPATVLKRVAGDTSRPLLAGNDKSGKVIELMESRQKLYEAIPNRIDTDSLTANEVATRIISLFKTGNS